MKEKQGLKFMSIDIENFKNISKKTIQINGKSLLVIGSNGSGKSSFIQSLLSPINSKIIPSKPIKEGEDRAMIEVVLAGTLNGEEKKYILDLYFTQGNQSGRLVALNENGETLKSPATLLKSIIGNISFDIFEFLNAKKADKIDILKKLTGKGKEIDIAANEIKELKEGRKKLKDKIEDAESSMANHGFSSDDIEKYSNPIDLAPIQTELSMISASIDSWSKVDNGVKDRLKLINDNAEGVIKCNEDILSYEVEIAKLEEKIQARKDSIDLHKQSIESKNQEIEKGKKWLEENPKPSAESISKKLTDASVHNGNCQRVEEFAKKQKELIKSKQELQTLGITISGKETAREKIISQSQLPVEGLTFTDDDIYIDQLPLEDGQINTAKLIDIGTEIAMSLNPNLRVIFVHDGSLIDNAGLKSLLAKAEAKGYQVIIERVSLEQSDLEVKFTETEIQ